MYFTTTQRSNLRLHLRSRSDQVNTGAIAIRSEKPSEDRASSPSFGFREHTQELQHTRLRSTSNLAVIVTMLFPRGALWC